MSILKRAGAAPQRPETLRGRKRNPGKRVEPAQPPEDQAAAETRPLVAGEAIAADQAAAGVQRATAVADGLRSAIAEVGCQLDEALRRVTDLKTQADGERDGTAAVAIEAAAADFDRAVEKVDRALAEIGGAAAREAAGAIHAFHRDFTRTIQDIVDRQRGSGEGVPARVMPPSLDDVFGVVKMRRPPRAL